MENKIKSFKDLIVWRKATDFAITIYKLTKDFPKEELYGLTSQLRRAAVSISSNIAEGFKRDTSKDKRRFYSIALGSLAEAESQLTIAERLYYIKHDAYKTILNAISELEKMLHKFIISAKDKT